MKLPLAGLLTAMAIGTGLAHGAGPGLIIRPGALLPITMAAGTILRAAGAGARAHITVIRFMDQRLSAFLAGALVSVSAGSRWDLASRSSLGTAAAATTFQW